MPKKQTRSSRWSDDEIKVLLEAVIRFKGKGGQGAYWPKVVDSILRRKPGWTRNIAQCQVKYRDEFVQYKKELKKNTQSGVPQVAEIKFAALWEVLLSNKTPAGVTCQIDASAPSAYSQEQEEQFPSPAEQVLSGLAEQSDDEDCNNVQQTQGADQENADPKAVPRNLKGIESNYIQWKKGRRPKMESQKQKHGADKASKSRLTDGILQALEANTEAMKAIPQMVQSIQSIIERKDVQQASINNVQQPVIQQAPVVNSESMCDASKLSVDISKSGGDVSRQNIVVEDQCVGPSPSINDVTFDTQIMNDHMYQPLFLDNNVQMTTDELLSQLPSSEEQTQNVLPNYQPTIPDLLGNNSGFGTQIPITVSQYRLDNNPNNIYDIPESQVESQVEISTQAFGAPAVAYSNYPSYTRQGADPGRTTKQKFATWKDINDRT